MASKRSHTFNVLLCSILIIIIAIRFPLLPIRNETKLSLGYPKDSLMNFTELTAEYGYASEEHTVITEDGYVLTMFRIVGAKHCRGARRGPPVVLMHGLLQSADSWIDSGPSSGLGYLIADACHDLWLGNTRGNYYSRRHTTLDPDEDPEYWQFSVDEIGYYDLPAFIDYVLEYTRSEKVNYIGFSQGAATYFIMCSERPEYCEKARVVITLAPAARQTYTKSIMYRMLAGTLLNMEGFLTKTGVHEVFSKGAPSQEFVAFFCQITTLSEKLCAAAMVAFDAVKSSRSESVSNTTTRTLFGHFPAGTSVHNMARYGQAMKSHTFQKFDYGSERNLELYGSVSPAEYNMSAVTVPVVAIYGQNDGLVDTEDVEWLLGKLPRVQEAVLVSDPLWKHMDVSYSKHTSEMIYPKIYEYLLRYSYT